MVDREQRPVLLSPLRLRGVELKNRVVIPPMCQYSAQNGMANDWHMVHLGQFATGGAGLIFTEAVAVEQRGRITYGDLGLWADTQVPPLHRVAAFIRDHGAVPAIQLAHSGRKGSRHPPWRGGSALTEADAASGRSPWQTIGPSTRAYDVSASPPRALDAGELSDVVNAWREAAQRAVAAGFQVLEIHAAHGYFIHQFLSATSNDRTDAYGGSVTARMRLLMQITEAVRDEWPAEQPLFVRLSVVDDADPGWGFHDTCTVIAALMDRGVDVIDCSSGGICDAGSAIRGRYEPGYQVGLAHSVKRATGALCMAGGLITQGAQAEGILEEGQADLVAIGREALADPHWTFHAAQDLGQTEFTGWPPQYGWWLEQRQRALRQP